MTLNTLETPTDKPQRGETLLLATHNAGKARELATALAEFGFVIQTFADHNLPSPPEDGGTFEANATLKASYGRTACGHWTLADDSGLEVDALDGAPGVETAHFGGWQTLLERMKDIPTAQRGARFVCVLALQSPQGVTHTFHGFCTGHITAQPEGEQGFGYDPVFQPDGRSHTFATMSTTEKQSLSHRGHALQLFTTWLTQHA